MPSKTVFVTGATGFIGSQVSFSFRRAGYRVLALVRSVEKAKPLVQSEIELVVGELAKADTWKAAAASSDVIVHAAADYDPATIRGVYDTTYEVVKGHPHKTVIITTGVWVHGSSDGEVSEASALNPPQCAGPLPGIEKLYLDGLEHHTVVLRPGLVYGRSGSLIAPYLSAIVKNTASISVPSYTGTSPHWPVVHVDDLAEAYVAAAQHGHHGHVYNIVAQPVAANEFLEAFKLAAGNSTTVISHAKPNAGLETGFAVSTPRGVSSKKSRRDLGWNPTHVDIIADAPLLVKAFLAYQ